MRVEDVTHLMRSFDVRSHPSHRFALVAAVGAGLLAFAFDTADPLGAVSVAAGSFAAWTLGREIDPDRPVSAGVAAILTAGTSIVLGAPAAGPVFVAMVAARIVVRSGGLPPTSSDLAVVGIGATVVAGTPWGWAAGIALVFGMVRDATLPGDPPPAAAMWAGLAAVAVTVRVALSGTLGHWTAPSTPEFVVVALGLVAAATLMRSDPVVSVADITKKVLDADRLREGRIFGLAPAVLALVASGSDAVVALAPIWMTATAVAVVRLRSR